MYVCLGNPEKDVDEFIIVTASPTKHRNKTYDDEVFKKKKQFQQKYVYHCIKFIFQDLI